MISFIGVDFPTPGGLQSLIINLTKELNRKGEKIKLFGNQGSFVYKQLRKLNCNFVFINTNYTKKRSIYKYVNHNDIFIITNSIEELNIIRRANPKIVFWNIFPTTLITFNRFKRYYSKSLNKKIIRILLRNNALLFMDQNGLLEVNSFYKINICNPIFLPIPIEYSENKFLLKKQNHTKLQITYIGRAESWKMYPLLKIIEDINTISNTALTVISDDCDEVHKFLSPLKLSLSIDFLENLNPQELREFLIKNSDLNIGMGTACLESSILGIPTLLIDPSFKPIPREYKYKWIFESVNYSLGQIINETNLNKVGNELEDIVNNLNDSLQYRKGISAKCYSYALENHLSERVIIKLLKSISESNLNLKQLHKYFFNSYRIYHLIIALISKVLGIAEKIRQNRIVSRL